MPPPEIVATILVPSAEQATADHASMGAEVSAQFWPKAGAAARQRLPIAMMKERRNLFFTITPTPVAMCMSSHINRLSPGAERLKQSDTFLANGGLAVNGNRADTAISQPGSDRW